MHAYSRRARRARVTAATALEYWRFLTRWQHVAPGAQLGGIAGLRRVLEQLQGVDAPAVAWESHLLPARLHGYQRAWLDQLCHGGEVTWLRLRAKELDDPDRRAAGTSKATPISVVFRADLGWLLAAHRGAQEPEVPAAGAVAEVVGLLHERGALFASELAAGARRLPAEIEQALWEAVARGLVTGDGFAALRELVGGPRREPVATARWSRLRTGARPTTARAGRWSLVAPPHPDSAADPHDLADAVAEQLLHRWGVVVPALAAVERLALPWREVQWALRRLEDRGVVRGGRFVAGLPGEQFALPEAADELGDPRSRAAHATTAVTVNAADPLNLSGVLVPGPRVPAVRTNTVTIPAG
jgi:ATP-dependent Lhr-like helicase